MGNQFCWCFAQQSQIARWRLTAHKAHNQTLQSGALQVIAFRMPYNAMSLITPILGGICLGSAWLLPSSMAAAILSCPAVICLVHSTFLKRSYISTYLIGCIAIAMAFYWIPSTVKDFGGFETLPALVVFILFISGSSIQFIIFAAICQRVREYKILCPCAAAISWIASEWLWIRIFPWEPAHSLVAITPLVQIASIGGTASITFLLFWSTEGLLLSLKEKQFRHAALPFSLVILSFIFGFYQIDKHRDLDIPQTRAIIVQANISLEEKHSVKSFTINTERYIELSKEAVKNLESTNLVIWPETVILRDIPDEVTHIRQSPYLPYLGPKTTLVTGSLTLNKKGERFNSALAILAGGEVLKPYHKQILMPFGEYMPGTKLFPWLQKFNPMAQGFTAGEEQVVFAANGIKLAPLICYEDILPSLSREASQKGANVLINLTNDAWFGDSHAPLQHHQIASFRAIENGRYLLRSTNTGLSAIVNPLGQTLAQLPVFSEGKIEYNIKSIGNKTLYTEYVGNLPRYLVLFLIACILLHRRGQKAR